MLARIRTAFVAGALTLAPAPASVLAQPVEFGLTAAVGYDVFSRGDSGETLDNQLSISLENGFEVAVGSEVAYQAESLDCLAIVADCDLRRSPIFDRVKFWTLYVEPRYRIDLQSARLHPFVGARATAIHDPGLPWHGFAVGGVGGVEYRFSRHLGVLASGILDVVNRDQFPDDKTSLRAGLRGGLRVRF